MRELSLHILDILENAVQAGATRIELRIEEDRREDRLAIEVLDNGRGMEPEMVRSVLDPFVTTRTTRSVGLGLPLLAAAARRCEGDLAIESEPGRGTRVRATFRHSHLDRAPLGDVTSTLLATLLGPRPVDVAYTHTVDNKAFRLDTADVRATIGDTPLSHPTVRQWMMEHLAAGEKGLYAE